MEFDGGEKEDKIENSNHAGSAARSHPKYVQHHENAVILSVRSIQARGNCYSRFEYPIHPSRE